MTDTIRTRDQFATLADARALLDGTADWDWGTVASWDGWTEYAYRHAIATQADVGEPWVWDHDATLRAYLVRVGVDPAEFQL